MQRLISFIGIFALMGIAYALSNNRKAVKPRIIVWGLILQVVLALIVLRVPWGQPFFDWIQSFVNRIIGFAETGSVFVLGNWPSGFSVTSLQTGEPQRLDVVLILKILPILIFFSALMSILYHFGIMQIIVKGMAWAMTRLMGTSGAEALSVAADVFVGMTEAPLVIRPYIARMTQSELFTLMVGGLATIAGTVFALYASFGISALHMLTASIMAAPAAILIAKIMIPETATPETLAKVPRESHPAPGEERVDLGLSNVEMKSETVNVIDAAASGATTGLHLALNVMAMLLAFVALIAMVDFGFNWAHGYIPFIPASLRETLGYIFVPIAWVMGVEPKDCFTFGQLIGTKICATEFVAYLDLARLQSEGVLSQRTVTMATYALCGFANFMSIAIQIGGIGGIAPNRRQDLARLGLKAMIGGTLVNLMTAAIVGVII